jgi:hypothetical protein
MGQIREVNNQILERNMTHSTLLHGMNQKSVDMSRIAALGTDLLAPLLDKSRGGPIHRCERRRWWEEERGEERDQEAEDKVCGVLGYKVAAIFFFHDFK